MGARMRSGMIRERSDNDRVDRMRLLEPRGRNASYELVGIDWQSVVGKNMRRSYKDFRERMAVVHVECTTLDAAMVGADFDRPQTPGLGLQDEGLGNDLENVL
jgi:hypothetical protein